MKDISPKKKVRKFVLLIVEIANSDKKLRNNDRKITRLENERSLL